MALYQLVHTNFNI